MRIYGSKDLTWVKNSLWLQDNYILAVVPDETHKKMFWIKWPDGTQSTDFYNISRAKDHAVSLTLKDLNLEAQETGQGEALDAIK